MSTPRAAVIQDLSGFGRCSMTLALPALSAMGVQCCPVLTAYLSSHTGGLGDNTFCDLTDQMAPVAAHWQSLGLAFDAILTGFMSSSRQIRLTRDFLSAFRRPGCPAVVDPVMGDGGQLYRTCTPGMRGAMAELAADADVITPNRTEAAVLLGVDYGALTLDREEDCRNWAGRLSLARAAQRGAQGRLPPSGRDRRGVLRPGHRGDFADNGLPGPGALPRDRRSLRRCPHRRAGQRDVPDRRGPPGGGFCIALRLADRGLDTPRREGLDFEPLLWRLGAENGDRS